jgi:hypothetical protein
VRFATNQGRALAIGEANSTTATTTTYPNKKTGFLAAIRGYEGYTKTLGSTVMLRGAMHTLQVVWANCNTAASGGGCA